MNCKTKNYVKDCVSSVEIPECLNDIKAKYYEEHKEAEYDYDKILTIGTRRRWWFVPVLAASFLVSILSVAIMNFAGKF